MSKDIVTRLRGKEHGDSDRRCKSCDSFCCHCELCDCCLDILEVCLDAADEIERLRELLLIFDTYFVCEECYKACATYLQGCENPLHALHTAAWELF